MTTDNSKKLSKKTSKGSLENVLRRSRSGSLKSINNKKRKMRNKKRKKLKEKIHMLKMRTQKLNNNLGKSSSSSHSISFLFNSNVILSIFLSLLIPIILRQSGFTFFYVNPYNLQHDSVLLYSTSPFTQNIHLTLRLLFSIVFILLPAILLCYCFVEIVRRHVYGEKDKEEEDVRIGKLLKEELEREEKKLQHFKNEDNNNNNNNDNDNDNNMEETEEEEEETEEEEVEERDDDDDDEEEVKNDEKDIKKEFREQEKSSSILKEFRYTELWGVVLCMSLFIFAGWMGAYYHNKISIQKIYYKPPPLTELNLDGDGEELEFKNSDFSPRLVFFGPFGENPSKIIDLERVKTFEEQLQYKLKKRQIVWKITYHNMEYDILDLISEYMIDLHGFKCSLTYPHNLFCIL